MEKATIYDYARMCRTHHTDCSDCPMCNEVCTFFMDNDNTQIDEVNEIILKWCKEHPIKTRQSELLKKFPNAKIDNCGTSILCPQWVEKDFKCNLQSLCCGGLPCSECRKEYWLAEVEENNAK